jgi:hypothetical protein
MTATFTAARLLRSIFVAEEEKIPALLRAERAPVPVGLAFVAVILEADHAFLDGALWLGRFATPTLVVHGSRPLAQAGEFDSSLETLLS